MNKCLSVASATLAGLCENIMLVAHQAVTVYLMDSQAQLPCQIEI
jgi:hypothetical protein